MLSTVSCKERASFGDLMDVLNKVFAKLAKRRSGIPRGALSTWIVKPDKSTRSLMLGNFRRRSRHSVEGGWVSIRFRDNHAAVRRELHRSTINHSLTSDATRA